ncbi:MAG: hypothetical protein A2383_03695 [Candidatus Pacebacteria bacterium RIFOXYB1_FULL_39_46]|nr:MAG: hypothetical protein A2182_03950 [Candidatus Pacebacteria bacterium RIFOXYA1_FULL_38_18]OGJ38519.1 MAG: hypothetical protein A2383_03695 [Candidatus Pacebacteria bacterium RIFOXYB1_FULL_39_46]OGJ40379.1 MAG: hypothetical protein A2411_03835 [Candidatus Pacebacteria bacterium RIFOXYC1_FULL_39_21]OGJ40498.1 MAG: hypothetical protein A2582_02580 [Candidatus Pacebacteria bacterium RIFOXYD1_FULL_39_27]
MRKIILIGLSFFLVLIRSSQIVSAAGFGGGIFVDENATPVGFESTDNRCAGLTTTQVSGVGFKIKASRPGEENSGNVIDNTYSVQVEGNYPDYSVTISLPYPPPDPTNAWQCACNANPLDAYQCVFTNQNPATPGPINVFVKRANVQNNAWWQVRGGNVFSKYNIQSLIPVSLAGTPGYCNTTAGCLPALIGDDNQTTLDSPGFAFSSDGIIYTHATGGNFIHDPDQRSNSDQGFALGISLPTENYAYFYKKMSAKAMPLPSSQKPTVANYPAIYHQSGDLTIGEGNQWHLTANEQIIVFLEGNLIIDDQPGAENRLITVERGGRGFLAFISQGDVIITPHVGYANVNTDSASPDTPLIEGVFITDGTIWVQSYLTNPDKKFIAAGTFVGWTGINLQRSFAKLEDNSVNNTTPTETFVFRPDFMVNIPTLMKSAHFNIREIQPRFSTP